MGSSISSSKSSKIDKEWINIQPDMLTLYLDCGMWIGSGVYKMTWFFKKHITYEIQVSKNMEIQNLLGLIAEKQGIEDPTAFRIFLEKEDTYDGPLFSSNFHLKPLDSSQNLTIVEYGITHLHRLKVT